MSVWAAWDDDDMQLPADQVQRLGRICWQFCQENGIEPDFARYPDRDPQPDPPPPGNWIQLNPAMLSFSISLDGVELFRNDPGAPIAENSLPQSPTGTSRSAERTDAPAADH